MMYPFRMYGRIIQIYRWQAVYTIAQPDSVYAEDVAAGDIAAAGVEPKEAEIREAEITEYFVTESEARATGGVITPLDTAAYEWLDGIEVADVPDTYAEAVRIYEMGEAAYLKSLTTPTPEDDLLAMAVDHEYRLNLLELGITE